MGGNAQLRQQIHAVTVQVQAAVGRCDTFEEAKEQRRPGDIQRRPVAEDHNSQSQEAEARHIAVGGAVGGGQGIHKTAHACQSTGNGSTGIAHLIDVDAQAVRRLGILTAGPQPEAEAGLVEDHRQDNKQQDADIGCQIHLVQEGRPQETDVLILGNAEGGFFQHKPGGRITGGHLQGILVGQNSNQEQHQSRGHQVQGRAADGLVCLQVDGGEAQQQGEQCAQGRRHQHCQQLQPLEGQPLLIGIGIGNGLHALHIPNKQNADKGAEDHNAFQGQIDNTAALGKDTGQCHDHQRHRVQQRLLNQKSHASLSPFSVSGLGAVVAAGSALALGIPFFFHLGSII